MIYKITYQQKIQNVNKRQWPTVPANSLTYLIARKACSKHRKLRKFNTEKDIKTYSGFRTIATLIKSR